MSPRVCPPYPSMPAEAKAYLTACCTVDPDEGGPMPRAPAAGSEALWTWLADIALLRDQLAACR